jgi:pyruvate kinase
VGILADLSGPKIRIESFVDGKIMLAEGQPFALDTSLDPAAGNDREVGCAYKDLIKDVKAGDSLLLADGYIVLEVLSVKGTRIECVTRAGGELSNRKGLNRQGGGLSAPALTDKDLEYIQLAAEMGVDWLAVSFARDAADIRRAQAELRKWRGTAHVVAKIERHEAIDNLAEILGVADAVMVARGDLGVEMGYAALTGLQKTIIQQAQAANRIVITATQMMESMISSPVPTRARSHVANAVPTARTR